MGGPPVRRGVGPAGGEPDDVQADGQGPLHIGAQAVPNHDAAVHILRPHGGEGGAEYTGALQILKVILSYDYLWQNIRVKGGAYGCMSNFNRIGEGYLISYRDPNLEKTMEIYEGVVDYLENFNVDDRDMNKFIIGTISNIDRPMNPAAKGSRSMNLYMNHVTEEMIREEREQILTAGQSDIRALSKVLRAMLDAEQICVIGSEEKIEECREMFGEVRTLS